MKKRSLKNTILYSILAVIAVTGILIILLGYFIINNVVIDNAQLKAKNDLAIAKSFYQTQISDIERAFTLSSDYSKIKKIMKLD